MALDPDVAQGLVVSGAGMVLVFLALGLLMFVIVGLDRLFRPREQGENLSPSLPQPQPEAPPAPVEVDGEVVAAISVALAHLLAEPKPPISFKKTTRMSVAGGAWKTYGRQHIMNSRKAKETPW